MKQFTNLFSPIRVGTHILKNRIILAPMGGTPIGTDGTVTEEMIDYFLERAKGGAAEVILACCNVDWHNSRAGSRQLSLTDIECKNSISRLVDAVHPFGTKVLAQLHHPGSRAFNPNFRTVSASGGITNKYGLPVYGLDNPEVKEMIQKFIRAAKIGQSAGLDGVQIHAGHGYLISEFLSPLTNKRTDEYGGTLENRARMLIEIIKGIREACGKSFLLDVRLAVKDWAEGGNTINEGIELAKLVEAAGVDMINITTGITTVLATSTETQDKPEGNRVGLAEAIRPHVKVPISIAGKLRSPDMCEEIISNGTTNMVTLGRTLICDPYWPQKAHEGRQDQIRKCISCSEGCYNPSGMHCALNPYAGFESRYHENEIPYAREKKKVVVIGGGAAGMQAAITAAQRGHNVILLEKEAKLGGQMIIAAVPLFKADILNYVEYMENEMRRNGIHYQLGVKATADEIAMLKPDKVIIAVGSIPAVPPIPGAENAIQSWDVLSGKVDMPRGKEIVIIGGGAIGTEIALYMAEYENKITILEMTDKLAATQQPTHRARDLHWISEKKMDVQLQAKVTNIEGTKVTYQNKNGEVAVKEADMVILSTGQKVCGQELYDQLWNMGINAELCGDSRIVGNIRQSVASGFRAGYYA